MFRKSRSNAQRQSIANIAYELVPAAGNELNWASPLVGRFVLRNITGQLIERKPPLNPPYYILDSGLLMDPVTKHYPFQKTLFTGSGLIYGVLRNSLDAASDNLDEVKSSVEFQLDNDLFAPDQSDYNDLERFLNLAKQDAVRV